MRFKIVGANAETGDDVDVVLEAESQSDVERIAHEKGILVSAVSPAADETGIALVVEDAGEEETAGAAGGGGAGGGSYVGRAVGGTAAPAAHAAPAGNGHGAHPAEHKHGLITVNANSPSDSVHVGEGHIAEGAHADTGLEYHILMNQSLYLLETAVNKYLRDGWEPQGGLTVGMSNNALQYFQSIVRKKKAGQTAAPPPAPMSSPD